MTQPDDSRDDPGKGPSDGRIEPELPFDEEAAWRSIVENYGERVQLGETSTVDPAPVVAEPVERDLFDRSYLDALESSLAEERRERREHAEDTEHFVPPEPPPVPRGTPARRLAWCGLFGAPLLMLAAVVFGLQYPAWFILGLVVAFIGGFVFLVATMPRDDGDDWDDGAVV
jgi:hypothetical protein